MAKNDFRVRNIHWKGLPVTERLWFIAVCVLLVLLFIGIALDAAGTMKIPSWAALLWAGLAGFAAYQLSSGLEPSVEEEDEEEQ